MELDSYLVFFLASIVLCVVPGPDMAHLLARTVAHGRRQGLMAALGMNLGGYLHLVAVVVGLSALLATSAVAFSILKWAGACYLIYIGIRALLDRSPLQQGSVRASHGGFQSSAFLQGFLSDVLNPKVALFFLAFLPQFIPANSTNQVQQLLTLGLTVNFIALVINILIIHLSSLVARKLQASRLFMRWSNRVLGIIFIGLGLRLAREKM